MRLMLLSLCIVLFACKKDDPEPSAPLVTTVGITDITDTSVKVGGNITSDGGEVITAAGFCWTSTPIGPSIEDDTTVTPFISGGFVSELFHLQPSTTYYVRAYAINSLGIGYGDVITFNTGNAIPVITSVSLTGTAMVDSLLFASYTFSDAENDRDSATFFQWYNAIDSTGLNDSPIAGANDSVYTVTLDDTLRFIRVGVVPRAATGSALGNEVRSHWLGPVPK